MFKTTNICFPENKKAKTSFAVEELLFEKIEYISTMTRKTVEPIPSHYKWTHPNEDAYIYNNVSWLDSERKPEVGLITSL